ncbi:MAG: TonB-dependent receptor, partial [Thermaurantiacus sp.]
MIRHSLRAALLSSLTVLPAPLLAQAETTAALEAGDQIIVTGTRRVDRTVADSPVPIDVVSAQQLQQTGLTETARALRDLVPSFNFP